MLVGCDLPLDPQVVEMLQHEDAAGHTEAYAQQPQKGPDLRKPQHRVMDRGQVLGLHTRGSGQVRA